MMNRSSFREPLSLSSRAAGAKAYLKGALGGATLFFLYDEIIYPSFEKFAVESSKELGLNLDASADPFVNFRKKMEPLELKGARKLRPLFEGVADSVPVELPMPTRIR